MRCSSIRAYLAAALLGLVVSIPFLPLTQNVPDLLGFEVQISTQTPGVVQLYSDFGNGFAEARSASVEIDPAPAPRWIRFPLPEGTLRALRFDPLRGAGTVTLHAARVVERRAGVVQEIPLAQFKPAHEIAAAEIAAGALRVTTTPNAGDPQLSLVFDPPLHLKTSTRAALGLAPWIAAGVFAGIVALLAALDRLPRLRERLGQLPGWAQRNPRRALAGLAALTTVASAYPVVFLGKSYVSPNLGTVLLYDRFPTLPRDAATETTDVKLSDIGAVMWSHLPISVIQHRSLGEGDVPVWNRYNSLGVPLLGQGQSMFGDPIHLGVVLAGGASWAWDLKYLVAKWLFATGVGLLAWTLVRHLPSALLVAGTMPFIGFFVFRINHPAIFSLCYAPWPLYCWVRIAQAARFRGAAAWSGGLILANLALMNSGTAKEAYMLLLTMNFAGACVLLASPQPWAVRLGRLALLAWAGAIFVLLTAPIWGTFLATLRVAYTSYNAVSAYQIQPTLLLAAFDEIFYRPLMTENRVLNPSANFVVLLGLLYFLATLRLQFSARPVMALAVASLPPLALAFGLVPPQWIVRLPFLANVAHVDNTFTCALLILWPVLAAAGFATAARRLGGPEGRSDLIVAGLLLGALVFGWIAFGQAAHKIVAGPTFTVNQPGQTLPVPGFVWGYLAALLFGVALVAFTARRALRHHGFSPALGLVFAVGLVILLWRFGLHARAVGFDDFTVRPTPRANVHARSDAIEFVRRLHAAEPGRGYGIRGNFFPGWTAVYGLETIHGPDALMNGYVRELTGLLPGVERIWDWRLYGEPARIATAQRYLDALNVRFYFDLKSDQAVLGRTLTLRKGSDLDVYESPTAWPRAFFTDRLFRYERAEQFVQAIGQGDGRPFAAIQRRTLEANPTLESLSDALASRTIVPATAYRLGENRTSFRVQAPHAGVVVLAEAHWPGYPRVFVNGQKQPLLRLNHAFNGVHLPAAGNYTIEFAYVPPQFPRNLMLSGIGAVLLIGTGLVLGRSGRQPAALNTSQPREVARMRG